MNETSENKRSLVFSYLALRKAIGFLGTTFPFVLALGAIIIFRTGIQSSVSSYYHTGMRDVFVGTLCAIGFFLLSYRGHELKDDIAGTVACVSAVGVALFPTTPDNPVSGDAHVIGYIHLVFAAAFFITLICFSLFLFTKKHPKRPPTRRKLIRNKVYKACGYTMSACILLIVVYFWLLPDSVVSAMEPYKPVFWLEAVAVVAFGISWVIKGEALLKDEVQSQESP